VLNENRGETQVMPDENMWTGQWEKRVNAAFNYMVSSGGNASRREIKRMGKNKAMVPKKENCWFGKGVRG